MKNKFFSKAKAIGLAGMIYLSQLTGGVYAQETKEPNRAIDLPTGKLEIILREKDSKDYLIHVKQSHIPPTFEKDANFFYQLSKKSWDKEDLVSSIYRAKIYQRYSEKNICSINRCQEQIYNFIMDENQGNPEKVYCEGIPFGKKISKEELDKKFNLTHRYLQYLVGKGEKNLEFKEYLKNAYYAPGAFFPLSSNGIKIVGADMSREEQIQGMKKYLDGEFSDVMEKREECVIKNILNEKENPKESRSVKYLIYGADHKFEDDVERWNLENPNRKYNFLTFTPKELFEKE